MALGEALMEEQIFRKNGLHKIPSILEYKSPDDPGDPGDRNDLG